MRGGARRGRQEGRGEFLDIPHWKIFPFFSFNLKLQFPRDNKDMGVVGGREETEGVYK